MTDTRARLGYSVNGAADETGVSRSTINRAIKSGALRTKRSTVDKDGNPAGLHIIPGDELRRWLDNLPDA